MKAFNVPCGNIEFPDAVYRAGREAALNETGWQTEVEPNAFRSLVWRKCREAYGQRLKAQHADRSFEAFMQGKQYDAETMQQLRTEYRKLYRSVERRPEGAIAKMITDSKMLTK